MPFQSSQLYPGETIVDEGSPLPDASLTTGNEPGRGRVPRNWFRQPFGALPGATPLDVPLIPRSEWDERIQDMEQAGQRLSDLRLAAGIKSLHQGNTNYCWANAVISAMMILQAKEGGGVVRLSPASVAAPLKDYRDEGGFGVDALDYIVKFGVCSQDLWPPNAIDRQFDNPASQRDRRQFKITEWWELGNRRFDQLMTLLLLGVPVPIGLDWWRHEVCALDPVKLGAGSYGVRIWNSWGDNWEFKGMQVLSQTKAGPDDAVAPRA